MSEEKNRQERLGKFAPNFFRFRHTPVREALPPASEFIHGKRVIEYIDLDGNGQSIEYSDLANQDKMPLPAPNDRENYGTVESSHYYWATGYADWLNVKQAIERFEVPAQANGKIRLLDFGSATGRFLRHPFVFGSDAIECWGSDFTYENVKWVHSNLPPELKFFLHTDVPHLPFRDAYFDIVTGFSVIPHIDFLEDAWLLELRRITNPDGILYLTIQNEATWARVPQQPGCLEHMSRANRMEGNIEVNEALFNGPIPEDRIVLRMSESKFFNCNIWVKDEYIYRNWSQYFEVLKISNNAHSNFQSVVILKPK